MGIREKTKVVINIGNDICGKLMRAIKQPWHFVVAFDRRVASIVPDRIFLKSEYRCIMGRKLDLHNPKTFNEKLQWLKLYDRNPKYTDLVDKYAVRGYIETEIGSQYLVPLLGVWEDPDDIDFTQLPKRFVLKCNHGWAMNIVCKNKDMLDVEATIKTLREWANTDFYKAGREWPYKNVKRKIICETYVSNMKNGQEIGLIDYKFFVFSGRAEMVMICVDRAIQAPKFYFFDRDWRLLRLNYTGKNASIDFSLPKPQKIDEMFELAEKLSGAVPFVRIDLYEVDDNVYFGEYTLYPSGGFDADLFPETDTLLGEKLLLT